MKRTLLITVLAAFLFSGLHPALAKKGGNPHDDNDDQGDYLPPGQAKKHKKPYYDQDQYPPPGQVKEHGPPPWAPAHGYRAKQRYRYYPAHNIYQDPVSGIFFTLQAGGVWVQGGLPIGLTPDRLGSYREFDGYKDEPWANNPYRR